MHFLQNSGTPFDRPDDATPGNALFQKPAITGHRRITGAYLLALPTAGGGVLATLDPAVAALSRNNPAAVKIIT
jgi:hypothetical protein